jgi:hypothetical protein
MVSHLTGSAGGWRLIHEVWFAQDSPLEGNGFEASAPMRIGSKPRHERHPAEEHQRWRRFGAYLTNPALRLAGNQRFL